MVAKRASRRKHHITYKTTCMITGRYYIGMHSTDILEDGYLGSGVRLRRSVAKHGAENHTREILATFSTREEASQHERTLITEDVRQDPQCMNCAPGGRGAVDRPPTSEQTSKKISAAGFANWGNESYRNRMIQAMNADSVRKRVSEKCKASFLNPKRAEANRTKSHKACTVDGKTIYPSVKSLIEALGRGQQGTRATTFRFVANTERQA